MQENIILRDIYVADTETTGFGPAANVVEYAHAECVLVDLGEYSQLRIVEEVSSLINPQSPIPEQASKIHGITDDLVADSPSLGQFLAPVRHKVGEHSLMLGHNFVDYDWQYLDAHFLPKPQLGCTLRAARQLLDLPSNKLGDIYERIGGPAETAHRAAGDVRMTVAIINHLLRSVSWEMLHQVMTTEQLPTKMPFGKHKGKLISELPRDYIEWGLANMTGLRPALRKAMELALEG